MKLIIDIPEWQYKSICEGVEASKRCGVVGIDQDIHEAIYNGTPLPKGHGDLIDKSKIYKAIPAEEDNCTGMGMSRDEMDAYNEGIDSMYSLVQGAPTIIEADKEVNDD